MDEFDRIVTEFMTETLSAANVTISNSLPGSYDPATGTVASTSSTVSAYGILMDLTLQSNGASLKYGTMVQAGDKELYLQPPVVSGYSTLIVPGQTKIVVAGLTWSVVTMKEINPTGTTPILYTLYLRR